MNRPLIITIGIMLLFSMMGLWVYLLAYGAPEKPREVFTNLGFLGNPQNEAPRVVTPTLEQNPGVQLSLGGSSLQQLTTRAVAGFAFVNAEEKKLQYAEKGTGHLYEIDLTTGTERQISLTTVPQTAEAVFGPDARSVVLITYEGYAKKHLLGLLHDNELLLTELPDGVDNLTFKDENTLYFTREENAQTIGYSYKIDADTTAQIARVPFGGSTFVWGSEVNGIYAYPKPTEALGSSVYQVKNTLVPISEVGKGTVAFAYGDILIASFDPEEDIYTATAYIDAEQYPQAIAMLPEKCTFIPETEDLYCAASANIPEVASVMNGYKGTEISADYLWRVDLYDNEATVIANLKELGGRTIDVDGIALDSKAELLLLRNKIDDALWLYKVPQS